jgi:hypothetical protein
VVLAVSLLAAGCGGGSKSAAIPKFDQSSFKASNFVDPTAGTNKWLPLVPGTQWVREGTVLFGNRKVPIQIVSTVTDVVRVIGGVKAVAVLDHNVEAGQVVQQSIDYFAQDKAGAIWTLGSITEQYEAGRFVDIDEAWLHGADGAKAGILMPANPTAKTPPWLIAQPPGADPDAAEFVKLEPTKCAPFDCFQNVLVIREGKKTALDNELKYYAAGVGLIRNEPRTKSRHDDVELLTNDTKLSPEGLAEASAAALRIDAKAAAKEPDLFGDVKAARVTR